ncbi:hypothetical protein ACFLX2_00755 [Candidatus Dependentiae bacterium]
MENDSDQKEIDEKIMQADAERFQSRNDLRQSNQEDENCFLHELVIRAPFLSNVASMEREQRRRSL